MKGKLDEMLGTVLQKDFGENRCIDLIGQRKTQYSISAIPRYKFFSKKNPAIFTGTRLRITQTLTG